MEVGLQSLAQLSLNGENNVTILIGELKRMNITIEISKIKY